MKRRALLASLATGTAAVAGCLSGASDAPEQSTTTDQPTTTPGDGDEQSADETGGGWPPEPEVVSLQTQSRTLSLFPTRYRSRDGGAVSLSFAGTATAEHPARLRVTLQNVNDFSNVFRLDDHPPLQATPDFYPELARVQDTAAPPQDPRRVYLAPLPDQSLPERAPAFQRGSNGMWRLADEPAGRWLPDTHRLDAGESVTVEFAVVGAPGNANPFWTTHHTMDRPGGDPLTLAAWNTATPGPTSDSRFAGESFPALPGDDETGEHSVAWYHEATPEQAVYLDPTDEQTDLPKTVAFSLVNHAREPATGNPYYWSLYKLVDGAWQKLEPEGYPVPMGAVAPGDEKEYRLRLANGDPVPCSDGISVGRLGGGTYAFEAGMSVEDRTHAAVLEVDAPPVTIEPTDGLDVSANYATVTVTDPRWEADRGRGVVEVTRADEADRVLAPELAARRYPLRNTLPFFEDGVDAVKLRSSDGVARDAKDVGTVSVRGDAFDVDGTVTSK